MNGLVRLKNNAQKKHDEEHDYFKHVGKGA